MPISYADILLPPDAQTLDQVLTSSGIPNRFLPSVKPDALLDTLMEESRRFISTPEFAFVVKASLQRGYFVQETSEDGKRVYTLLQGKTEVRKTGSTVRGIECI